MAKKKHASSSRASNAQAAPAWTAGLGPVGQLVNGVLGRLPAQFPDQVEKGLRQGQEALGAAVGALQSQLNRKASQADIDRLTRRVDELTRQVQELTEQRKASGAAGSARSARPDGSAPSSSTRAGSSTSAKNNRRRPAAEKGRQDGDESKA